MNRSTKRFAVFFSLLLTLTACGIFDPVEPPLEQPTITSVTPASGATNVALNESIAASLSLPNDDVDNKTLTSDTVRLVDPSGAQVPATVRATANKTITLEPTNPLTANTQYRFEITSGVKDLEGESFVPFTSTFTTGTQVVARPSVQTSTPADGATNVNRSTGITTNLSLPGSGVDRATLNSGTVRLIKVDNGVQVATNPPGSSGGGDVITLSPRAPLEANTKYLFEVTDGVKNLDGVSFIPYTSTFTTGTQIGSLSTVAFKATTVWADGDRYTTLVMGPDGKLYATTPDGRIKRFAVAADGSLSSPETLTPFGSEQRLLIGLAFDPSSTATNLVAWVSHTYAGFQEATVNQPWSGKISRLSGPNLQTVQDYVVGLPRSFKDHVTNSVAFGPDGALYFNQGANTAMGAADSTWRWQPERLLNAAMLRLDISKVTSPPLNVKTEDGGTYNPFAANAPLTIYGRGVRNAYDLVWHSNGQLYAPANGSAAGGNVPRYDPPAGSCETRPEGGYSGPKLSDPNALANYLGPNSTPPEPRTDGWKVETTQHDFLFRVVKDGYYGHPNPKRCEWILNGGNTSSSGSDRVSQYPSGTPADPNYRGFSFDFGVSKSPNGAIEYKSNIFGDKLAGKLLVLRYSLGNDILVLTPGDASQNYNIIDNPLDVPSLKEAGTDKSIQFIDPLDLVENTATGDIYVSDFDQDGNPAKPEIVLLRPSN